MDRTLQLELVDKLTLICTESGIDPDQMEELLATFDQADMEQAGGTTSNLIVDTILDFFSTNMKMQEWNKEAFLFF